jgi:hypothetical protein
MKKSKLALIGDVHGKINEYHQIIQKYEKSIQLGDFGFQKEHEWLLKNIDTTKHKILFGNHDYYPYLFKEHSLGNSSFIEEYDMIAIRGAYSIDRHHRTIDLDWFENEELNYVEMRDIYNEYEQTKPKIVISHECPNSIAKKFFSICEKNATRDFFDELLKIHKPEKWFFAHHHKSKNEYVNDVNFICLDELEIFEI